LTLPARRASIPAANRGEATMTCDRLFAATNATAYYSPTQKTLVVSVDVTLNPTSDHVHICRNILQPLLPSAVPEFVVSGSTSPGIHADLMLTRSIRGVFPMEVAPASVVVYSMGVDAPARTQVSVGAMPPQDAAQPPAGSPAPAAAVTPADAGRAPIEVTGWSAAYDYNEALADAVKQLRAAAGFRNPDAGIPALVVQTGVQVGGFVVHTGFFVKLRAS
jgi:hypothetical protein